MSPFTQTSYAGQIVRPTSARSVRHWFAAHTKLVNIITFSFVILLGMLYIIQVNNSASQGYKIRDLQSGIHQLSSANEQARLEIHKAQSLENVQRSVKMFGMVPAVQAVYVESQGNVVAFAK